MSKRKAKAKSKPRKKPRAKKGLSVVAAKSGKRKTPKRRAGLGNPFNTLKGAFIAATAIRMTSGLAGYIATSNNKGEELPKVKMLVPAAIIGASYMGVLPTEYMIAGSQSFVDQAVENTDFLKNIFDFKFMKDLQPKKGLIVRDIPQTRAYMPMQRAGMTLQSEYRQGSSSPMQDLMSGRNGSDYQR